MCTYVINIVNTLEQSIDMVKENGNGDTNLTNLSEVIIRTKTIKSELYLSEELIWKLPMIVQTYQ